jgi:hypothetical protein
MTIYKSISTLTSADGTLPILAGGTGANNSSMARFNLGLDPADSFTVSSGITAQSLAISSNAVMQNAIAVNLAVTSTATIAALTVSSNFSALNSSFDTLDASSAAIDYLSATTLVASAANIDSLAVTSGITAATGGFTNVTVSNISVANSSTTTLTVTGSATFSSSLSVLSASATTLYVSSDVTLGSSASTLTFVPIRTVRPNMPSFLALSTVNQTNVTGAATAVTVQFGDKVFDRTANYSTATFTFTAPITGIYALSGCVGITGLTSNHTAGRVDVIINSARTFTPSLVPYSTSGTNMGLGWAFSVDMTSGHTAVVQTAVLGASGGADIIGGSTLAPQTWFGGYLVG